VCERAASARGMICLSSLAVLSRVCIGLRVSTYRPIAAVETRRNTVLSRRNPHRGSRCHGILCTVDWAFRPRQHVPLGGGGVYIPAMTLV
jgi:hypothetical protein